MILNSIPTNHRRQATEGLRADIHEALSKMVADDGVSFLPIISDASTRSNTRMSIC